MKKRVLISLLLVVLILPIIYSAEIPDSHVKISLINQNPFPAQPGETFEVQFRVELGRSGRLVQNLNLNLLDSYPFKVKGERTKYLGTLSTLADDFYIVKFNVEVDEDATEYNNTIKLNYGYDGASSITKEFNINIETRDPLLYIKDLVTNPYPLVPGQEGTLTLTLKNFADTPLHNIQVYLGTDSFVPIGSSSLQTIKLIDSKQEYNLTYNIVVDPTTESKVHKTSIQYIFEDNRGNKYIRNNTVGILINDPADFLVNLEESDTYQAKSTGRVVFSISNIATSELKFLTLELIPSKDYEVISSEKVYLGNLESDDFETADFNVYIGKVKNDMNFLVKVSYKDAFNTPQERIVEVPIKIYSSSLASKFGVAKVSEGSSGIFSGMFFIIFAIFWFLMLQDMLKTKMKKQDKIIWIILFIGSNILGAILYYFFIKRKKNAK